MVILIFRRQTCTVSFNHAPEKLRPQHVSVQVIDPESNIKDIDRRIDVGIRCTGNNMPPAYKWCISKRVSMLEENNRSPKC